MNQNRPLKTDIVLNINMYLHHPILKAWRRRRRNDDAHLSGLKADGLEGSKSQVAPVGELSEATDDAGKQTEETDFIKNPYEKTKLFSFCPQMTVDGSTQTV